MIQFAPSILAADFANLERDIRQMSAGGSDWIHIDVMDGMFVPNITVGFPIVQAVRKVTDLKLDVHLMIQKPIRYVERFVKAGADYVTIHLEADTQAENISALKKIRALGAKTGISLRPGTPAQAVLPYLPFCDLVLVMTVEPGFGGQKFMPEQLSKLIELRHAVQDGGWRCLLSVDGGVDRNTAPLCAANGADALVAGSAYFRAEDREAFTRFIHSLGDISSVPPASADAGI